jgi:hypothetical protein
VLRLGLEPWLELQISQAYIYALIFLLGSFTVATLSDLKYMSAQREFVEVWVLAIFALLAYDVYLALTTPEWAFFLAKWVIILVFSFVSYKNIGIWFKLAIGDVAACAAVSGLLTPVLIVLFFIILKILSIIIGPFLRIGRKGSSYPFMPIVLLGTLAITAFAIWAVPAIESMM